MTDFGDTEPEDAWDVSDPPDVLVDNVRRRIALILLAPDRHTDRVRLRGDDVAVDIAYLRDRVDDIPDLRREVVRLFDVLEELRAP
jgi:hypothetical protein